MAADETSKRQCGRGIEALEEHCRPKANSYIAHKIPSSDFLDNESAEMSQNLKNFDIESTSPTTSQIGSSDKDVMNNAYRVFDYMMSFQGSKSKIDKPVSSFI